MSEQTQRQYRTPLFRAARRIVDAVEDVVDDVVARGEDVEKDTRRLMDNMFREHEEKDGKREERSSRTATKQAS